MRIRDDQRRCASFSLLIHTPRDSDPADGSISTMAATFSLFSPAELSFSTIPLTFSSSAAQAAEEAPLRPDGRLPLQYRDLILHTGVSQAQGALGSAKVVVEDAAGTAGAASTEVWAGVRGEIENVQPGQTGGRIVVGLEWSVTCPGPVLTIALLQLVIPATLTGFRM